MSDPFDVVFQRTFDRVFDETFQRTFDAAVEKHRQAYMDAIAAYLDAKYEPKEPETHWDDDIPF